MHRNDILGYSLEEGLLLLKENSNKKIEIKETLANKNKNNTELVEPRIIRCIETENNFNVVISYF